MTDYITGSTYDIPAALAAMPDRLTALLFNEADAEIDAELAEAEDETGLFDDLSGTKLAERRYFHRLRMLAETLHELLDEADGTTAAWLERQRRMLEAMSPEEREARDRANRDWLMRLAEREAA